MRANRRRVLMGGVAASLAPGIARANAPVLVIDTPMAAPRWAVLQRQLLARNAQACEAFYAKYVDRRDWLQVFERWGANDGPDDAAEATNDWAILHALGGPDRILSLTQRFWEGHLRQYTAMRTVDVPIARQGMYYRDFPVQMDWQHNAEGLTTFNVMGLSAPRDPALVVRTKRFADFYTGRDPSVRNYDPQRRIIRSVMNGSRGPMLRPATSLDWAGDPFEAGARFHMEHGETTYQETLDHYAEYNDVVGDNPLNLHATTLGLNAYALGGGERYRRWALDYLDAWVSRAGANNGIVPSKVGLDGKTAPDWWGGVYGWGFSPVVPQTGKREDRNRVPRSITAFMNGTLLTGDSAYIEVWRRQNAVINDAGRQRDGKFETPTMYGADGWYGWKPRPYRTNGFEIWYVTQRADDLALAGKDPWVEFLQGRHDGYPIEALNADLERVAQREKKMREDDTTRDTRLADWPLDKTPASVKSLIQLMAGGLHIARPSWSLTSPSQGGVVLHARLRYFDAERRRAGVPQDVAALVHALGDATTEVTLVNLGKVARTVTVQGGAYAEHRIERVTLNAREIAVGGRDFTLRLEPGCGARLKLAMRRYANTPTLAFPWDR
ncbi:hypothetical protein [Sphingomonas turrisvirgatae]|uniref:Linalool dehydratase/isomerase domain-containing protein n=1 Tax=Sphingomonas turrisvirgatae TaxID=1888892 RepID=A0A1E3LWU9_9SPHN|nr:hypothetical protein [Sphingomonas turrisvirgatae]ODP37270.1 hypothetical protein BFL28_03380 [Sphingomonas turrisvirgatae]